MVHMVGVRPARVPVTAREATAAIPLHQRFAHRPGHRSAFPTDVEGLALAVEQHRRDSRVAGHLARRFRRDPVAVVQPAAGQLVFHGVVIHADTQLRAIPTVRRQLGGGQRQPADVDEGVGTALLRAALVAGNRRTQRVDRGPNGGGAFGCEPAGQPVADPVRRQREVPLAGRPGFVALHCLAVELVGHLGRHHRQDPITDPLQQLRIQLGTQPDQLGGGPFADVDPDLAGNARHRPRHHVCLIEIHRTRGDTLAHDGRGGVDPLRQPYQPVRRPDRHEVPAAQPRRRRCGAVLRGGVANVDLADEPHERCPRLHYERLHRIDPGDQLGIGQRPRARHRQLRQPVLPHDTDPATGVRQFSGP